MDLNRQVREMERILKRKNPDSVSALILTANSENEKLNLEKMRLLEDRIGFLENEIKAKEDMAELKLTEIQMKFADMKDKYLMQISELELKLQTSSQKEKKIHDASTQTIHRILESRSSEPNLAEKVSANKVGPKSHNLKEDTHLIATIRGLKQELGNKEKSVAKLTKDLQELHKSNRKLQKERDKLYAERRTVEKMSNRIMTSSDSKLMNLKAAEIKDPNSNFYQNGHLTNGKRFMTSCQESIEVNRLRRLASENEVLKDELSRINKDFVALKNKRLQDLNILQEEHEKEIAHIVKECNVKIGDTRTNKLQVPILLIFKLLIFE
jgi:protein QN1